MSSSLNVFVTERNVEIFLSKLHHSFDGAKRDAFLRLLVAEESRMGAARQHVENGERRVIDGRQRLERQRIATCDIPPHKRDGHPDVFLLETLETTQRLLEQHLRTMRLLLDRARL